MIKNSSLSALSAMKCRPSAWIRVTGEDARTFLQGQFTQDLRVTGIGGVAYGLWLNQKGRVLADSWVLSLAENELYLWSEASSQADIRERLDAYIIADDVALESLSSEWEQIVIAGPGASAWVEARLGGALPAPGIFARCGTAYVFRGRHGAEDSWIWLAPHGTGPDLSGIQRLDTMVLARARIYAGIPSVPREVGPGDLPNEAGLDEVAISYTKGCYLGQEVMARLKAMGRVRRRLVRVSGLGTPPACPAPLWQGDKTVGELRAAMADGEEGCVGLAMINLFSCDATAGLALSAAGEAGWSLEDQL